ncbi:MAG: 50S ribosomal protein L18Ae [Candidatus Diapherotrites archaeon]
MQNFKYQIKGRYKKKKEQEISFNTQVIANNEKNAKEKALANIGSRHKVQRNHIKIETIQKLED